MFPVYVPIQRKTAKEFETEQKERIEQERKSFLKEIEPKIYEEYLKMRDVFIKTHSDPSKHSCTIINDGHGNIERYCIFYLFCPGIKDCRKYIGDYEYMRNNADFVVIKPNIVIVSENNEIKWQACKKLSNDLQIRNFPYDYCVKKATGFLDNDYICFRINLGKKPDSM